MRDRSFWLCGGWLLLIAAGPLQAAGTQAERSAPAGRTVPGKPNIVFILADDLGYADLACQGSKYYETPNIDRLAAQGLRFTQGYTSAANCQPTRAALMSGQYGARTGVYTVGGIDRFDWQSRPLKPVENVVNLPLSKVTVARALKNAGYATAMFGKWHLGEFGAHHPGRRGFDEAIVSAGKHFDFVTSPKTDYPKGQYLADFLTDKAEDFIRRHKDKPFFLYLSHYAVHSPIEAKPELIAKFRDKPPAGGHQDPTYAAMIASLDESVGRLVVLLDQLKIAENTLVIFSSDNGGVGGYQAEGLPMQGITDNSPLRGGKATYYDGGIRVPYIFRWTGKIKPATECHQPIISVDLYPTLLELGGADAPADYTLDGKSYLGLLTGDKEKNARSRPIYWHFPGYLGGQQNTYRSLPLSAVRDGDWKLIEFMEDGRLELYNLREDIGERNNLASSMPDKARSLQASLHEWRRQINAPMPTPNTDQGKGKESPARKQAGARNKTQE